MTSPAAVLEAVRDGSRMITDTDLGALFDVSPRIVRDRSKRGELPKPLSTHPYVWSPQQIARFLDADRETA